MRKLFKATDEYRAASLGKLRQLDRSSLAVPSCGERESQWGVQSSDDYRPTSRQRRHVQVLRRTVRLEIRVCRRRTTALQGGQSHTRMRCLPRSREYCRCPDRFRCWPIDVWFRWQWSCLICIASYVYICCWMDYVQSVTRFANSVICRSRHFGKLSLPWNFWHNLCDLTYFENYCYRLTIRAATSVFTCAIRCDISFVAGSVHEQAQDVLVPPLLWNCLTPNDTFFFP